MDIYSLPYQLAGTKFTLQRWLRSACEVPFICLYTDCLVLNRGGIKPLNRVAVGRHNLLFYAALCLYTEF